MMEYHVPDMSCGHCAVTVTRALHLHNPTAEVRVELSGRRIRVGSAIAPDDVLRCLADAGYPAEVVGRV